MRYIFLTFLVLLAACANSSQSTETTPAPRDAPMQAPTAAIKPHITELHGTQRVDNYFWLREKTNPETIAYLEAENTYTQSKMKHTQALQKSLYDEMLHRIVEDDASVPNRKGDYLYYSRTVTGKPYSIYCRKEVKPGAKEEILLDVNALAVGQEYMDIGVFEVSPDQTILAFSTDTSGYEQFTLQFKDLKTGKMLPDTIEKTYYSAAWGNDNATIFYTTVDEANRPFRLHSHRLGTKSKEDRLVFEEPDDRFFLNVAKTRSGQFITMSLESAITTEVHTIDADTPAQALKVVVPRQQGHEYQIDHHGDYFYILSNLNAQNFKLLRTPTKGRRGERDYYGAAEVSASRRA